MQLFLILLLIGQWGLLSEDVQRGAKTSGHLGSGAAAPVMEKDNVRLRIQHVMVDGNDIQPVLTQGLQPQVALLPPPATVSAAFPPPTVSPTTRPSIHS